jgi:ABC-type Co2+ transport system permease subunit
MVLAQRAVVVAGPFLLFRLLALQQERRSTFLLALLALAAQPLRCLALPVVTLG